MTRCESQHDRICWLRSRSAERSRHGVDTNECVRHEPKRDCEVQLQGYATYVVEAQAGMCPWELLYPSATAFCRATTVSSGCVNEICGLMATKGGVVM